MSTTRTSTVDLSARILAITDPIQTPGGADIQEAAQRLLELRRLLDAALPAVELFGDVKTMQAIRKELGL